MISTEIEMSKDINRANIGFTGSLRHISIFTRIFGLNITPTVCSVKCAPRGGESSKCQFWLGYSLVVNSLFVVGFILKCNLKWHSNVSALDYYVNVTFILTNMINMMFLVFFTLMNTQKFIELCDGVDKIGKELQNLSTVRIDYLNVRRFTRISVHSCLLTWTAYLVYYMCFNCPGSLTGCLSNWHFNYFPTKVSMLVFLVEITHLKVLKTHFEALNTALRRIHEQESWFVDGNIKNHRSTAHWRLDAYRNLHYRLCRLACDFNVVFSFRFLTDLIASIISLFLTFYIAIFGYPQMNKSFEKTWSIQLLFLPILIGAESMWKVYFLCRMSSTLREEAGRTGRIIQEMSFNTSVVDLKEAIMRFSVQLLHHNVNLTVCGMFNLDYSTLHSIVTSVTTHLFILIQFHSSSSSPTTHESIPFKNTVDTNFL